MIDLSTLTALAQAATPGEGRGHDQDITGVWRVEYPGEVYPSFVLGCYRGKADVDYIVATQPRVILALVTRVREAETKLSNLCKCANRYPGRPTREYSRSLCPVHQDDLASALTPSEPRNG